jgi:hypothetical protein
LRIKNHKDFWSGLMFVAIGGCFAWAALGYALGTSARPGPGYFPLGLGAVLALLGGVLLAKSLALESVDGAIGAVRLKPLAWIVASLVVFAWLLPRAGLLLSLPLLVVMASRASDEFRWPGALAAAVALTALSYLIFVMGLSLSIPVWPIART